MRLLVTGSNGFLGRRACLTLRDYGFHVTAYSRSNCNWPDGIDCFFSEHTHTLSSFDSVLHLAGRAHVMNESDIDPLSSYRKANFFQTLDFARNAALSGVKRFVYISSVKVNGEFTSLSSPFRPSDLPNPLDPYAISKFEAEQELLKLSEVTGMEVVIIRPPLIYGPNVKGNLRRLISLLSRGVPLPLAGITFNRRSYISMY